MMQEQPTTTLPGPIPYNTQGGGSYYMYGNRPTDQNSTIQVPISATSSQMIPAVLSQNGTTEVVPSVNLYIENKDFNEQYATSKSRKYLLFGIAFTILGFAFIWTYILPWIFFFVGSIFFSLLINRYYYSQWHVPRRNAKIAMVLQSILTVLFIVLLILAIAAIFGGIFGSRRYY